MKKRHPIPFQLLTVLIFVLLCTVPKFGFGQTVLSKENLRKFNLKKGKVQKLEFKSHPKGITTGNIAIDGNDYEMVFHPYSIRSENFKVMVQTATGNTELKNVPFNTVRGSIVGMENSVVVGSKMKNGFVGQIDLGDGNLWYVEPLRRKDANAARDEYVIFNRDDVATRNVACGTPDQQDDGPENFEARDFFPPPQNQGSTSGISGDSVADIGLDSDYQFYDEAGDLDVQQTVDEMENIILITNQQFENETAIRHRISFCQVRTNPFTQPYQSTDSIELLEQFQFEWEKNFQGVARDVAHLFTGKNIDGNVIGRAFFAGICNSFGYGFSESTFDNNIACRTDLTAHELGHNWNAMHCDCPDNTMNPFITCNNTFATADAQGQVLFQIADFRQSILDCLDFPPANDSLFDAEIFEPTFPKTILGDNRDATIEAGEPDVSTTFKTVWWRFQAEETRSVTFDTFSSDFDTVLHVYDTFSFLGIFTPENLIVSNEDANGTLQSEVCFEMVEGETYLVRVGGFFFEEGNIRLNCDYKFDRVELRQGVNGYNDCFDIYTGVGETANDFFQILGSDITATFIDGICDEPNTAGGDTQALIRFDGIDSMIPPNSRIVNATLDISTSNNALADSPGPFGVSQLLVPFDGNSTYENAVGGWRFEDGEAKRALPNGFVDLVQSGNYEVDVTEIVQAWVDGEANYGFLITAGTTNGAHVFTTSLSNLSDDRPGLTIDWAPNGPSLEIPKTVSIVQSEDDPSTALFFSSSIGTLQSAADADPFGVLLDGDPSNEALMRFDAVYESDGGPVPDDADISTATLIMTTSNCDFLTGSATHSEYRVREIMVIAPNEGFPYNSLIFGPIQDSEYGMIQDSQAKFDVTEIVKSGNAWLNIQPEANANGWAILPSTSDFGPELQVTYSILLGDVNCDGVVDLLDVSPFVDTLTTGVYLEKADMNQDGSVNLLDVDPFVEILVGS